MTTDSRLAALLLSNVLSDVGAEPLKAREFWTVVQRCDEAGVAVGDLMAAADGPVDRIGIDDIATDTITADRLRTLLGGVRSLAFESERLEEAGIRVLCAFDPEFPPLLRDRLLHHCPPHLFAAGDIGALQLDGLAVVGDDPGDADVPDETLDRAAHAVAAAVVAGWSIVTAAHSTGQGAVGRRVLDERAACEARSILVAAGGINRAARVPHTRRDVQQQRVCLVSPFPPDAPATSASGRARDMVVQALATFTFVVGCSDGTGPTWSTVHDTVTREPSSVLTHVGPGAAAGNHALAALGARPVHHSNDLSGLLT